MSIKKERPKSFCSVPWLQVHTEPDGKIFPCCYYSHDHQHALGNWQTERIRDVFHSDKWNMLRKDFLDGKRPAACSRCWKEEDVGITSMRERFNERYSDFPDYTNANTYDKFIDIDKFTDPDTGSVSNISLATIDLIFNNLCNLKCRSCGPMLSTSWAADTEKMGGIVPQIFLTNENTPHMTSDLEYLTDLIDPYTEIHFSGGEPMLQREHYEFLQMLIKKNKTKVKIRYNTNLTVFQIKGFNAFDILQNFENVFIVGSLDAVGKQGEYIRKGLNWEVAMDWLRSCKKHLPNADIAISAVYSIMNASAAIDLHKLICTDELFRNSKNEVIGFYLNTLHGPEWYQVSVLPTQLKLRVISQIRDHINWLSETQDRTFNYDRAVEHWENAINTINSADNTHLIPDFYRFTRLLDSIRNEKFEELFPELHQALKDYE